MRAHSLLVLAALVGRLTPGYPGAEQVTAAERGAGLLLSGTDWRIHEDTDGRGAQLGMPEADLTAPDWIPATVPGNLQADLEAAHHLKPLGYGLGDPGLHEVARKDWWYRKDFVAPESFAGKRITLVFDGVDHECQVWCNGRMIGSNAGMFRRFRFDVGDWLRPGKVNRLAVRIARMPEVLAPLVVRTDGQGVVNDATHFLRGIELTPKTLKELKSPTNWGWDWGVNIWTLGIWKDVRLEVTGLARIDWTRVQTALSDDHTKATVTVTLEIDSQADLPAKAQFLIAGPGQKSSLTVEAALRRNHNLVRAELTLDSPALWWPNGQGEQPLYTLHAELLPTGGGPAMDARATRFGVRDIRWVRTEGAPADFVSRYQLIVNGRPVRTIGSNLIPPDLLFGRMGPRTLHLLRRAQDAGLNTLRLWGGGVILHDEAYDLADDLGIMLVQELPLANHWPETNAVSLANLEMTARNIVRQVRNHPSIIEFDGGNEMPWNSLTEHPALELLRKIVAADAGHLFRATCPDLGATHGPWFFDLRTACRSYDERQTMRAGEFGSSSPAHLEVWHRDIPPHAQWPVLGTEQAIQIRKNIVQAVFEPDYWLRKTFLEAVFGSFDDLPMLVVAGQYYGAEGLRYSVDALRRKGKRIGGLTTWDFDEPWPNGAGSYLVDYDGRTLFSYDFFKQAIAPVSLSLRHDSVFYDPRTGITAELFLTSDAPQTTAKLNWRWLARDRRGQVLGQGDGTASIEPLEVKSLGPITLRPPPRTAYGPLFLELRLQDSRMRLLGERLHIFGADGVLGPFAGLLKNRGPDTDDDDPKVHEAIELPSHPGNLAFVGNGAKPAIASSARPEPIHQPPGINDGAYGNAKSWIGTTPRAWFEIDLGKTVTLGRFKLGRDRTGIFTDRGLDSLKIENSLDRQAWQTVFEQTGITTLPGFNPTRTMTINIAPVEARFLRVTVDPKNPAAGELACIDEFEVYGPAKKSAAALSPIGFSEARPEIWRPVRRTPLQVTATSPRPQGDREVLQLTVRNTGPMTALFCEPHPLIEYRTDLFIDNNHCFVPPGESRVITIRAAQAPPRPLAGEGPGVRASRLTLGQTGWRISCWNADDVVIEPNTDVLLAVGRRDAMCREFSGYFDAGKVAKAVEVQVEGARPDPGRLPYFLAGKGTVQFEFHVNDSQARGSARLRIHTADQSADTPTKVLATINGHRLEGTLPKGLGIQRTDPPHLASPATLELSVPASGLRPGRNVLEVRVQGGGWFTWDALEMTSRQ